MTQHASDPDSDDLSEDISRKNDVERDDLSEDISQRNDVEYDDLSGDISPRNDVESNDLSENISQRNDVERDDSSEDTSQGNDVESDEPSEKSAQEPVKIVLNIGGARYETLASTLTGRDPDTRLAEVALLHDHLNAEEYFFDRNPTVFKAVIEYYRSGS